MDLGLAGKTVLVMGGSRGLGFAVAQRFAQEGARLVISARDAGALQDATTALRALGGEVSAHAADTTDKGGITGLFQRLAADGMAPDVLVYNNSGPPNANFDEATDEDYLVAHQRVVMGFVWCVQQAAPAMKARSWGRIVTLGSMCVKEPHRDLRMVLHNLIRPAAVGLSKTLSDEFGEFGITVNTIGTGSIDTGDEQGQFRRNYRAAAAEHGVSYEEMKRMRLAPVPMRRAGTAEEVAALCGFLCSDLAGYITGQTVLIDGGRTRAFL